MTLPHFHRRSPRILPVVYERLRMSLNNTERRTKCTEKYTHMKKASQQSRKPSPEAIFVSMPRKESLFRWMYTKKELGDETSITVSTEARYSAVSRSGSVGILQRGLGDTVGSTHQFTVLERMYVTFPSVGPNRRRIFTLAKFTT